MRVDTATVARMSSNKTRLYRTHGGVFNGEGSREREGHKQEDGFNDSVPSEL